MRWITFLLLWVAAIVVAASAAGTVEATDSDEAVGESTTAVKALERSEFANDEPPLELVLVEAAPGSSMDAASDVVDGLRADLEALPQVAGVHDPVVSPDGTAVLLQAELGPPGEAERGQGRATSATSFKLVGPRARKSFAKLRHQKNAGLERFFVVRPHAHQRKLAACHICPPMR